jgi:predicted DNA-binding transcriptional regulator AlpA
MKMFQHDNRTAVSAAASEEAAPSQNSPGERSLAIGHDGGAHLAAQQLLSMRQVTALTTYSRASIYRLVADGRFPRPLKLGQTKIAFREVEVVDWLNSRSRA